MHERSFETSNLKINYILKRKGSRKISVNECVKIVSKNRLVFKDFKSSGEMYFPKHKLENFKNYLISIEIVEKKPTSARAICLELKRLFPTVFNPKVVGDLNLKYFLNSNKERIMAMCQTILGDEFVRSTFDAFNYSLDSSESEEEIIFDDIIENDFFHMELQ